MANKNIAKNRKGFKFLLISFIAFLMLISDQSKSAIAAFPPEFYPSESFEWTIDNISPQVNTWYGEESSSWYANVSDKVTFDITSTINIEGIDYTAGDLVIGNLTEETDTIGMGFNLVLSIYPWYGGLVSLETDLTTIIKEYSLNASLTDVSETTFTVLDQELDTVEINYRDAFQATQLIYEPVTGILLYTNTSFGSFWLEMTLTESTIPLPEPSRKLSIAGLTYLLTSLTIAKIVSKRKKRE